MSQFLPYQLIGLLVGVAVIFFGALVGLLAKESNVSRIVIDSIYADFDGTFIYFHDW